MKNISAFFFSSFFFFFFYFIHLILLYIYFSASRWMATHSILNQFFFSFHYLFFYICTLECAICELVSARACALVYYHQASNCVCVYCESVSLDVVLLLSFFFFFSFNLFTYLFLCIGKVVEGRKIVCWCVYASIFRYTLRSVQCETSHDLFLCTKIKTTAQEKKKKQKSEDYLNQSS